MNRSSVISKIYEIMDHYLLGPGIWPSDRESLPALFKMFRELGLNEEVTGCPGVTQSTALGKELKLDLIMAFVGAWDIWDIPYILVEYGFIEESQAEELCAGPLVEAELKLRWYVFEAYLQFCNHRDALH